MGQSANISLEGTLIDYQTASIGITSITGSSEAANTYYLALWEGYQVGTWDDTLKTQIIQQGELSMILFYNLNIS